MKQNQPPKKKKKKPKTPNTVVACRRVDDTHQGKFHCKTLLDSGLTVDMVTTRVLPKDVQSFDLKTPVIMDTGNGPCACTKCVHLQDIVFLELSLTCECKRMKCIVNEHPLGHDLIVGRVFIRQAGMNVNFDEAKVTWKDEKMPLHPRNHFQDNQPIQKNLTNEPCPTAKAHANTIIHDDTATECEETDPQKLAANQVQSAPNQRHQLPQALKKHACSFEGLDNEQLGMFPSRKHHSVRCISNRAL